MPYTPTIAIDFDGTIADHEFPRIGAPKKGVKEALTAFREMGFSVLIWSCRSCHWHYDTFGGDPSQPTLERVYVKDMVAYLAEHEIPYDEIDDGSRGKPLAEAYVDDKAVRFENNWPEIVKFVSSRLQ